MVTSKMKLECILLVFVLFGFAIDQGEVKMNDPHVIEIANFAVTEFNKEAGEGLNCSSCKR